MHEKESKFGSSSLSSWSPRVCFCWIRNCSDYCNRSFSHSADRNFQVSFPIRFCDRSLYDRTKNDCALWMSSITDFRQPTFS